MSDAGSLPSYEPGLVSFYEEHAPYGEAIDLGAGGGYHTERLAACSDHVHAIEPLPPNVDVLLDLEPDNITVVPFAVAAMSTTFEISAPNDCEHPAATWLVGDRHDDRGTAYDVDAAPLHDLLPTAKPEFMKVDIEGDELLALETAGSLLESLGYMAVEVHHLPDLETHQQQIQELLEGWDVEFAGLDSTLDEVTPVWPELDTEGPPAKRHNHMLLCRR